MPKRTKEREDFQAGKRNGKHERVELKSMIVILHLKPFILNTEIICYRGWIISERKGKKLATTS